jgi:hypothetical protein
MEKPTRKELRDFIDRIGGEDAVCAALGVRVASLRSLYSSRRLTASWMAVLCKLAEQNGVRNPDISWFRMVPMLDPDDSGRKRYNKRPKPLD